MNYHEASRKLNKAIAITNFGDYLSALAYGLLLSKLNNNLVYFGYIWTLRSLSQAIGALVSPLLLKRFNPTALLKGSQLLLGIGSTSMFFLFRNFTEISFLTNIIIASWLIMSVLAQVFLSVKESYAKELERYIPSSERVELASRLQTIRQEAGVFFGQAVGPLSFIVLVYALKIPVEFTILVDSSTFFFAWFLLRSLPEIDCATPKNLGTAIKLATQRNELISLFVVRGILIWISMGLLNFSLAPLAANNWKADLKIAPLVYVAIGFGGLLFSWFVERDVAPRFHKWFQSQSNATHAILSTLMYSSSVVVFSLTLNCFISAVACVMLGFANGIQRVALRQMTQRFCTSSEFHSFSSLLWTSGRISDFVFTLLITKKLFPGASLQFFGTFSGLFILICLPFFAAVYMKEKVVFLDEEAGR